jgi:hypothetical protein
MTAAAVGDGERRGAPSWWSNVWLRAGVLHPVLGVLPWTVACLVLAQLPGSELDDIAWGLVAVVVGALLSVFATLVLATARPLRWQIRVLAVALGLVASAAAMVAGLYGWGAAAKVACHGRYECPF